MGIATGTQDQAIRERVSLYPNPTTGRFKIQCREDMWPLNVAVFDITGRKVHQQLIQQYDEINGETLANGIYIAEIKSGNKDCPPVTAKFVKLE